MKRKTRTKSVLLMVLLFVFLATAFQESAQSSGMTSRLALDGLDVITASDAGGGYLYAGNIVLIVIFVLSIFGLATLLLSGRGREEDHSSMPGRGRKIAR